MEQSVIVFLLYYYYFDWTKGLLPLVFLDISSVVTTLVDIVWLYNCVSCNYPYLFIHNQQEKNYIWKKNNTFLLNIFILSI